MAHEVFISYTTRDKPVADVVCAYLEAHGVRCWIAPRDVTSGKEYGEEIIGAINQCRVMVLVLSASSNQSVHVTREVERAVSKKVTLIPLRIEEVAPEGSLEYFLGSVHWLDALTPPLDKHLRILVTKVQALLSAPDDRPAKGRGTDLPHKPVFDVPPRTPSRRIGLLAGAGLALLIAAAAAWALLVRNRPPEIVDLAFPATISPDGKPVTGTITFHDPDANLARLNLDVVEAVSFQPVRLDLKTQGQKSGSVGFSLFSTVPQKVTLRATLLDAAGATSAPRSFSFEAKIGTAGGVQVTVDTKALAGGRKGVALRVRFTVDGAQGHACCVNAFFHNARREPLPGRSKEFSSTDGIVFAGASVTPQYEHTEFRDVILFLPLGELTTTPGRQQFWYRLSILDGKTRMGEYLWGSFEVDGA